MKLDELADTIIDLSGKPSSSIVRTLAKGDLVRYQGDKWEIVVSPKKLQRGIWVIGLENVSTTAKTYVKIFEDEKPKMTAHERKVYIQNIRKVVKQWKHDEDSLTRFIKQYYWNLAELNRFADEDVRECMGLFPAHLLKRSGIVF